MRTITLEYSENDDLARHKLAMLLATGLFIPKEENANEPADSTVESHRQMGCAFKEGKPRYLQIDAVIYYWEDGIVNGVEDVAMSNRHTGVIDRAPAIPFAVKVRERTDNVTRVDDYHWQPVIDLEKGSVVAWPVGTTAKVNYRVGDEGVYTLMDDAKRGIVKFHSYVPACLGDHYNDNISLDIDSNGKIANFIFTNKDAEDMINGNLPSYTKILV